MRKTLLPLLSLFLTGCVFPQEGCETRKDVQAKVLEWWSRDSSKTIYAGEKVTRIIQDYILRGINEYLRTNFSHEDMLKIYDALGNSTNHDMTMRFIDSKFKMEVLG